MFLAGGLTPENVSSAILAVGPAGVDVHTGLEDATGRKCPHKVRAFMKAVRSDTD
jgi:phosphoribosylanthranilate isomerase